MLGGNEVSHKLGKPLTVEHNKGRFFKVQDDGKIVKKQGGQADFLLGGDQIHTQKLFPFFIGNDRWIE